MAEINKTLCINTYYDNGKYNCDIMKKPCPYVKPYYTDECVEMVKQVEIDALTAVIDTVKELKK